MAGNNSTVGLETVTFTDNMSFDGTERGGAMTTNGELWIGSTIARHVKKGSLVSPMGTVTIGYASPNITIDLAGGSMAVQTLTGNTGGAISPVAGNINTVGTGSITTAGAGNTLTTQLTGLTNHSVLVGAGTATITKVGPNSSSNAIFMAQGASADPVFTTTGTPYVTGISFDAGTNVLSTYVANTNVLAWTPVITSDGTPPTVTYDVRRASYIKIGQFVIAQFLMTFSSYVAGTGNVLFTGLPYAGSSNCATFPPGSVDLSNVTFAGTYCVPFQISGNSTFGINTCTTAAPHSQLQSTNFQTSSSINMTIVYMTDT